MLKNLKQNVEKAMLEHPLSKFKMQDALAFFRDLQFVDLRLQNGQVELILRSMELYLW